MKKHPIISAFGDHGILLRWPEKIDVSIHQEVTEYTHYLLQHFADLIEGYTIAYQESAIYLNDGVSVSKTIDLLKETPLISAPLNQLGRNQRERNQRSKTDQRQTLIERSRNQGSGQVYHIPVCYELPFALDLEELAEEKSMSPVEVIKLHTAPIYPVYFIGFLPGFPYLGGMDQKIAHPRRESPRQKVQAGAVGIAGNQTGIYPNSSPGGWNIIGQSPLQFFNSKSTHPSLLNAGDYIQFEAINKTKFETIQKQVKNDTYSIQKSKKK